MGRRGNVSLFYLATSTYHVLKGAYLVCKKDVYKDVRHLIRLACLVVRFLVWTYKLEL